MDIRNVSNSGNIDRSGDRNKRAEPQRTDVSPSVVQDDAQISSTGRKIASTVEQLAERARDDGDDREARVLAAKAKLLSGELDADGVVAETARRLAGSRFLSV